MVRHPLIWALFYPLLTGLLAVLAPFEHSLGTHAGLFYFHGAWVAGLAFAAATLTAWQTCQLHSHKAVI
jgi:hypothetical protein